MGAIPAVGARFAARARQWFAGLGFRQMWQLVVLLVLAATALFGGLDDVDTSVTPFEPGEEFNDGQYTLTVVRATLLEEITGGTRIVLPDNPGMSYLALTTQIRNDGTTPGNLLRTFDLTGQPKQRFVGAYRVADSTYNNTLGPGLSQDTAFIWEVPEGAIQAGGSVTLRVWKKKYSELMVTYGQAWLDSVTDYGQVTVPVRVPS
jgi:hypothetical protein